MQTERWLVLGVPVAGRDPAEGRVLTATLLALGGAAVQEVDGRLRTHVPEPPEPAEFLREARHRLDRAVEGAGEELAWDWEADRDWAGRWRRSLEPRRVGRRLVVAPEDAEPGPADDDLVLRIDPGMAFGTGEHGTTRGMLRLLEEAVAPGDRVLDVGTGSGILALAAVRLGAERVVALDVDEDALAVARRNLERNGVAGAVHLLAAKASPELLALLEPLRFDVTAANILAPALRPLLDPFRRLASADGELLLGGILEEEAGRMREAAAEAGWEVREEDRDDGWWTVRLGVSRSGPGPPRG